MKAEALDQISLANLASASWGQKRRAEARGVLGTVPKELWGRGGKERCFLPPHRFAFANLCSGNREDSGYSSGCITDACKSLEAALALTGTAC